MGEVTRGDLRVPGFDGQYDDLTPAEFDRIVRAEGYVKLEGIDVEGWRRLADAAERSQLASPTGFVPSRFRRLIDDLLELLAALSPAPEEAE